jgi:crotonobetainyl-CoA:carnitine CoA-transferase CaiB-like acyl-CoA transferase
MADGRLPPPDGPPSSARPGGTDERPGVGPDGTTGGPLHGLRVVEAATLAAGPMVGTALGEFGAEVIKVEPPGAGDPMRTWGLRREGIGIVWKSVSRNKRCVTLDLRQPEGQELFHELLAVSDVLVVGNRPAPSSGGASTTTRCTPGTPTS